MVGHAFRVLPPEFGEESSQGERLTRLTRWLRLQEEQG